MRKRKGSSFLVRLLAIPVGCCVALFVLVWFHWQPAAVVPAATTTHQFFQTPEIPVRSGSHSDGKPQDNHNELSYYRLDLSQLVRSNEKQEKCPKGMTLRRDHRLDDAMSDSQREIPHIPRIVHQTSRSRCLTPNIYDLTEKWQFAGFQYYLHDDSAMERLFAQEAIHFPSLHQITKHCAEYGTLKADLWRYLVLWVYGGIYADLDTAPNAFQPDTTISSTNDDALFVVEQYHMLSQYFMAVSPRHPLLWYAIQRSLQNLWNLADTGQVSAALATGPHALHSAFIDFRRDIGERVDPAGQGRQPVWAGHFVGTGNRSATVIGVAGNQDEYVHRDLLGMHKKNEAYKQMQMRHFKQDKRSGPTGHSCLSAILKNTT